ASRYLAELERLRPEILEACRAALEHAHQDLDFQRLDPAAFEACPGDSIDYAVMEKTDDAAVLPLDIGWSDVGSWASLWAISPRDADANATRGDVLSLDSRRNYVYAEHRLIATIGVEDLTIIETPDAVLVAGRDHSQEVKTLFDRLKREQRPEIQAHRKVYRPWGAYDSIDAAERFQVKRITVNPGAQLSLQMHHHRAEHWIVVRGTARVTRDDRSFLLRENESTFIPLGSTHRLENPGKIPLELIEVQSGSYLGEDDIVRYDDNYGRGNTS
ncbi:MAG: mannose-1-phosphate guanylyltransferase/mannose-6-phosphate isomerase, partial [Candidatus Competibacterales bacterium]|nr:mannose-1-phosphate guanylyltransferase/mannose-6-phosphate isomerase [Candidatus Competibacterales bacterium]